MSGKNCEGYRHSLSSVKRIKQKHRVIDSGASTFFVTPDKHRSRKCYITDLDNFDLAHVRKIVHNFYTDEKISQTIKVIGLLIVIGPLCMLVFNIYRFLFIKVKLR